MHFDLVADGDIDPKPLIAHHVLYSSAPDLYGTLLDDRTQALGVILEWDA